MKKILLLFSAILMTSWLFSQSLEIYYDGELLNPMEEITLTSHPDSGTMVLDILDVKNISDFSIDVICVREILENIAGSENSFCWGGLCFTPNIDTSPTTTTIESQALSSKFTVDHNPNGFTGTTKVKYTFYNIKNPKDNTSIIINYDSSNPNAVQKFDIHTILSKAYPNPANHIVSVDYDLRGISNARIAFFDLLGSKVNEIELSESMGTITISTADFIEGIYFYSLLVENKASQTQKLIIRH